MAGRFDQLDHLHIAQAARCAGRHARHDAGVETVAIERDDDLCLVRRTVWPK
jgi:hypothetical protein